MQPGRLVVVTGAQAAGKTSVAAGVAAALERAVHVDGDVIHRFVVSGEVPYDVPPPPGAKEQLLLRYAGALRVAATYANAGFDALVSDNVFGPHLDALLGDAEQLAPRRVHLVVLDPDADVVAARDRARRKTGYTDTLTPQLLVDAVRFETTRRGLWLDNGGQSLAQTVAEVLDRLDEGLITPPESIADRT